MHGVLNKLCGDLTVGSRIIGVGRYAYLVAIVCLAYLVKSGKKYKRKKLMCDMHWFIKCKTCVIGLFL